MKFWKWLLAAILPIGSGACGTTMFNREPPLPVVVTREVVIAPECGVFPVEPEPVDEQTLPPQPQVVDWSVATAAQWAVRAVRAELAGLQLQGERDAERNARVENAAKQETCATWSGQQDQ